MAGCWEFPGGKLEVDETEQGALVRELEEELSVTVAGASPLIRVRHEYEDRIVDLSVWRVDCFCGELENRDGQQLEWRHPDKLTEIPMLPADRPVVTALRLPDRYWITPQATERPSELIRDLREALSRDCRLIQLRLPAAESELLETVARSAVEACRAVGARLLINGESGVVGRLVTVVGADGIHLPSRCLSGCSLRPLPDDLLVAASCHDAAELKAASALGADFAVLGPVKATASHPGATPLGWQEFSRLVRLASMPVYAIGGMRTADVAEAQAAGGQGIAAIRRLWPNIEQPGSAQR